MTPTQQPNPTDMEQQILDILKNNNTSGIGQYPINHFIQAKEGKLYIMHHFNDKLLRRRLNPDLPFIILLILERTWKLITIGMHYKNLDHYMLKHTY